MIDSGHVTESLLQLECSKLEFFFLILLATMQAADVLMFFCSLLSFFVHRAAVMNVTEPFIGGRLKGAIVLIILMA
jgi:hypothetical protein